MQAQGIPARDLGRDSDKGRPFRPAPDAAYLWDALVDDAHVSVIVVDQNGVIEYANQVAADLMDTGPAAQAIGRNLADVVPPQVAADRTGMARERVLAGQSVMIEGMWRGKFLRSTYRPIPGGPTGQPRILIVSRLVAPAEPLKHVPEPGVMRARVDDSGSLSRLTGREMEILKLIGLGLSSADIASRLERSVKTVEWHRVSLGDKLGVTNRVELARIAIAAGLVGVQQPVQASAAAKDGE